MSGATRREMTAAPPPPPGFTLEERRLRQEEATLLSAALRETPNILGYLPRELTKYAGCLIAVTEEGTRLAGVCIPKRPAPGWSEVAILYVFADYRNQGLGSVLFHAMLDRLRATGDTIYCISREPSVLGWMTGAGMHFVPDWRLPFLVQFARWRHYQSLYRFRETLRKARLYRGQPPFRCAVLKKRAARLADL